MATAMTTRSVLPSEITLSQGDTDRRNFVIATETAPVNLTSATVVCRMVDNNAHTYDISGESQLVSDPDYTPLASGGIAIKFTNVELNDHGIFVAQFFVTDSNGVKTYPLGSHVVITVFERLPAPTI